MNVMHAAHNQRAAGGICNRELILEEQCILVKLYVYVHPTRLANR